MPLDVTVVDGMPRLAWLVSLGSTPRAVVGSGVDIRTGDRCTRVTEGAWDGDFAASDILQARHMFGSGLVADADGIVFCAASHTVEALYAFAGGGRILVSNSLAFLVRCSGVALDPRQPIYRRAHSLIRGLSAYDRLIYEHGDDRIYRYAYCNFTFRDGKFETTDKPVPPRFPNFESYKDYMLDVLRAVRDNAASPGRKRSYRLLTSVSSGYDSAVCAALGAAVGCDRAVTLATGRNNAADSGMPVAEALGMPCMARERVVAPADGERFMEADFFASFESGDTMFTAFSNALPGSLFLIGHYGDVIWGIDKSSDDDVTRTDMTGMGLQEYRLHKDFVTVPVAYIGALRRSDIHRIATSDAMLPYRVGGGYDRPVARRIVEEAGVPREVFGQKKSAASVQLFGTERMITEESGKSIKEYAHAHESAVDRLTESFMANAKYALDVAAGNVDGHVFGAIKRVGFLRRRARKLSRQFEYSKWGGDYRPRQGHILMWALKKCGERYATACPLLTPPSGSDADR